MAHRPGAKCLGRSEGWSVLQAIAARSGHSGVRRLGRSEHVEIGIGILNAAVKEQQV
jgi:hypothetical protein